MLDPAPACDLSGALLRRVSWITPNEPETQKLLKTDMGNGNRDDDGAAERLLACGVKNVLLKLGSRGCVIAQRNLKKEHVPAFTVNAVDTTAAGDAFNGGFAVGLMRGLTVTRSAVFASAVAAISVTRSRAQPSMPTGDEVDRFLEQRSIATAQEPSYSTGLMTSAQLTCEAAGFSCTPRTADWAANGSGIPDRTTTLRER
jgi:ribokinase